jgi:hypothetical protein
MRPRRRVVLELAVLAFMLAVALALSWTVVLAGYGSPEGVPDDRNLVVLAGLAFAVLLVPTGLLLELMAHLQRLIAWPAARASRGRGA